MKKCAQCKNMIPDRVQPWHKCQTCGKEFCGVCGDKIVDSTMRCRECRGGFSETVEIQRLV